MNHFARRVDQLSATTNFPKLKAFLPQNFIPWLASYLKYAFTRRYPFPDYTKTTNTGIYRLAPAIPGAVIKLAIAGDWGTGTKEAETIAGHMKDESPDLTIHLGDVYYVGDAPEIDENCFGKSTDNFKGVKWPHGARGSFALNGNHEMYANGKPYFTKFLDSLGMPARMPGQIASFFCLETDSWRIIALDTGYNSVGVPILSLIPGINHIPAIGGDCHLESALITWLRETVRPAGDPKATLLLSHHQYCTAFSDNAYSKPAEQLSEFFRGQDVVWIWGHEHRLGIYEKFSALGGVSAYGRSVGHSGMPVLLETPDPQKAPIELYDSRSHALDDGSQVGENGYVILSIAGAVLTLDYRDLSNAQLLAESFTAGAGGALTRAIIKNPGILTPV
jgi:hypothetical protein